MPKLLASKYATWINFSFSELSPEQRTRVSYGIKPFTCPMCGAPVKCGQSSCEYCDTGFWWKVEAEVMPDAK